MKRTTTGYDPKVMEEQQTTESLQKSLSFYTINTKNRRFPPGPKSLTYSMSSRTHEKKFIKDLHSASRHSTLAPPSSTMQTLGDSGSRIRDTRIGTSYSHRSTDFELMSRPPQGDVEEISESTPEVHESIAFVEEEDEKKPKTSVRRKAQTSTLIREFDCPIGAGSRRTLQDSCHNLTETTSQYMKGDSGKPSPGSHTRVLAKVSGGHSNYTLQLQLAETPPGSPTAKSQGLQIDTGRKGSESIMSLSSGSRQHPCFLRTPEKVQPFIHEIEKPKLVAECVIFRPWPSFYRFCTCPSHT